MKIICLVKFVPNIEKSDSHSALTHREKSKLIINPEDAGALAYALELKKEELGFEIEVVSMGPTLVAEDLKNLIRLGADKATLISDRSYQGSDSYATSRILAKYLKGADYNFIFTGSHTIDGGTGHIGPQIAEVLGLNQFSDIVEVEELKSDFALIKAKIDEKLAVLCLKKSSVLSFGDEINKKLGFVKYENRDKNVDAQFNLLTNTELGMPFEEVGLKGSLTDVRKNKIVKSIKKEKRVVKVDEQGIDVVYQFLKEHDYV